MNIEVKSIIIVNTNALKEYMYICVTNSNIYEIKCEYKARMSRYKLLHEHM
jgi:hypothetical protein